MARRFTRGRGRAGSKRMSSWFDIAPTITNVAATSVVLNVMVAAELAKRPFTVVRTHLALRILSDQSGASEEQLAAVGLCIVSDQAAAVGVAAVPTPVTDAESDLWFVHQWMHASFLFGSGIGFSGDDGQAYTVDSRAMRKLEEDSQILVVAESQSPSDGTRIMCAGRILIKEH